MKVAWKEIVKFKTRYLILGTIIFLISLLTMTISGLANGLSYDNASLIKDLPEGTFYMQEKSEDQYNLSHLDEKKMNKIREAAPEATFLSIQMGELENGNKNHSVVFVSTTNSSLFPKVEEGEVILNNSIMAEGVNQGDDLTNSLLDNKLTVEDFVDQQKFSHSSIAFINSTDFQKMYRTDTFQIAFVEGDDTPKFDGLTQYSNKDFLNTIPSYNAEQLSLNMIVIFLLVISGMLFGIFFYMINVQKLGTYGILKAVGMKTSALFKMMWIQMIIITFISLILSIGISQLLTLFMPEGMPFLLTIESASIMSLLFLGIGFIGATLSGFQISKVEPIQAINQGGV
ncbi:ABC transporter permease [Oceanobacillus iheyensis]|uniref:Putative hemin transport system permease protein HrtB n=1 Tax=Oceanobacillus jordanicus TaxID=2867266 RepID=A0AAW5B6M0_9BACI|nr:ABC transporter permease [Oceanobacillus jordanicus]AVQ98219.1 ABC transporter permease [Oceanobacillus iheyensis]MCG3419872.1 ABC transporter permease [Oceanobacillus jordanicus]